jgi:hypothetical protein
MRHLGGFGLALLGVAGLFGQASGGGVVGRSPVVSSGFGQVLSPARRSIPALQGTGGPASNKLVYAYPVYVGGYGYLGSSGYAPGADGYGPDTSSQPQQQQPNVTVVYPPQQTTVIINQYPSADGGPPNISVQQGPPAAYGPPPPRRATADDAPTTSGDAPHYLIAFKDHTVYSALAYWVDGDTLHYFTIGNTHNQVSLTLVDRDLTERLNQESGVDLKLPPPASAK